MPRAAPSQVVEQRITLGSYERNELRRLERQAKIGLGISGLSAVAVPLAIGTSAVAVGLGLLGFGLGSDLDKERLGDLVIGTPDVRRTRKDGSEQVIKNPLYGVPVLGPLFGSGMRFGEVTAETTTAIVDEVINAIEETEATLRENLSQTFEDLNPFDEESREERQRNRQRNRGGGGGGF